MDTAYNHHHGQAAPKTEQIFSELYRKSYETLHSFLMNLVHEKAIAEDLVHNVFLKFWLSMDRFQIDNYEAYLYMMERNEAITHLRRLKQTRKRKEFLKTNQVEGINFTEDLICQKETEALFQKAINHLSPQRRKVYVLCKIEGLPYNEVAGLLGLALPTVKEMMRLSNRQVRAFISFGEDQSLSKPKAKKRRLQPAIALKAA